MISALLSTAALSGDTIYLAVDEQTGQAISDTLLGWIRPFIIVGAIGLALWFLLQKQVSKVWTVIIIGAVVFALTIGTGETSLIGRLATFFNELFA